MNFDYDYVTEVSEEAAKSGVGMVVIYIVIGIVAFVIIAAFVFFVITVVRKKSAAKSDIPLRGIIFCDRCDNKYDVALGKCPYCNKKNLRKGNLHGRY